MSRQYSCKRWTFAQALTNYCNSTGAPRSIVKHRTESDGTFTFWLG